MTNVGAVPTSFEGTFIKSVVQTNQIARAEQKASYSIALGANGAA